MLASFLNNKLVNSLTERIKFNSFGFWLVLFFILFGLDQFLKLVIKYYFPNLLFYNTKLIFDISAPISVIILISLLILILVFYEIKINWHRYSIIQKFAWVLILSGGLSNSLERLFFSKVVDFIYIGSAVFNFADFFIILGLVLLLLRRPKY